MSGMTRKLNDFFQRKVNESAFLKDKNKDFKIHSNEEHVINQTCVTYLCILGESSSKVTLDSQPFHQACSLQFPKKKCGNRERLCQAN